MANPVDASAIAARWRPLSAEETVVATALLGDAWALIELHVPDVQARLDDETLDPAIVTLVETAMVLRVLRNPEGKQREAIEDYSFDLSADAASGTLHLTADELALLTRRASRPTGAFTIRPYGKPHTDT